MTNLNYIPNPTFELNGQTYQDRWLTTQEAARILGRPPATLSQWRYKKKNMPYCQQGKGGSVLYLYSDIQKFISDSYIKPTINTGE